MKITLDLTEEEVATISLILVADIENDKLMNKFVDATHNSPDYDYERFSLVLHSVGMSRAFRAMSNVLKEGIK